MVRCWHVTPSGSVRGILKNGLEPRIGPRSRSVGEDVPKIYVFTSWKELVGAVNGWLGVAFRKGVRMAVLELNVPEDWLAWSGRRDISERIIDRSVPPSMIKVAIPDAYSTPMPDSPPMAESLNESLEDAHYEFMELCQNQFDEIFDEYKSGQHKFLPWKVIPAKALISVWNEHAKTGLVRNEKMFERIIQQMLINVARLTITTQISGHTEYSFEATLESYGAEGMISDEEQEQFVDWVVDTPEGGWRLSDYGLGPLQNLALKLLQVNDADEQLVILDRMLNVTHQRSDLAAWFVEGGTSTLNQLAGKDEDSVEQQRVEQRNEFRQNRRYTE